MDADDGRRSSFDPAYITDLLLRPEVFYTGHRNDGNQALDE